MLSTLIIVFREVLEAALILGVLLAATRGLAGRGTWIGVGSLSGVIGAGIVAFFTEAISNAVQGIGQEVFNASVLGLAATMIGWHVVWMKREAPALTRELKEVGHAVSHGRVPVYALATIAFLAVLREGSEVVLFVYGLMVSGESMPAIIGGSLSGLLLGAFFGASIYFGLIKVPTRSLFSVTNTILVFLAAGMVSQAAGFLTSAGILPALVETAWNTSGFLSEQSLLGKVLHTLVGYTARPSGIQVLVYWSTIGGIVLLLKWLGNVPVKTVEKNGNKSTKIALAALLLLGTGIFGSPHEALASKKVYSPQVEPGELELEYRGEVVFDGRESKDDQQKHEFAVGYGVTDWWFTEVYGVLANDPGEQEAGDLKYTATELENRFQLSQAGEWLIDTGFMVENEFAAQDEQKDELKLTLLLEKDLDRWRHRANPFMEYQYAGGEDPEEEWVAGASWSTTYRLRKELEPGFELYWEYGNVGERASFDEQELQIGPVIYGKIFERIKYDVGYLFGVSENAPGGELKWIVEYEWRF